MKIIRLLNYYRNKILACATVLALIILFYLSIVFTARGCSESLRDGTLRQAVVDVGKGVKSIIEDINKDEN